MRVGPDYSAPGARARSGRPAIAPASVRPDVRHGPGRPVVPAARSWSPGPEEWRRVLARAFACDHPERQPKQMPGNLLSWIMPLSLSLSIVQAGFHVQVALSAVVLPAVRITCVCRYPLAG